MTITRSVTATAFERFDTCAQNAPTGMFEDCKDIREMIGDITDRIIHEAQQRGLTVCNCDGARNLEIEIYGYLRADNEDRFLGAEGFGRAFEMTDEAGQARIIASLERDRDFLANRVGVPA